MKKIIFLTIISLISFNQMNAQSKKPTAEQKQTLNPIIDQGFKEWTRTWSYDQYVGRSAKITSLTIDEDYGDIIAYGEFTYKRLYQNFTITFTANIAVSEDGFRLVKLSYVDNSGQRDSKTF
jgi:hypothetical protein